MYLDIGMLRDRNSVESLEFELLLLLRLFCEADAPLRTIFDFELHLLVERESGRRFEAIGVAIDSNYVVLMHVFLKLVECEDDFLMRRCKPLTPSIW